MAGGKQSRRSTGFLLGLLAWGLGTGQRHRCPGCDLKMFTNKEQQAAIR